MVGDVDERGEGVRLAGKGGGSISKMLVWVLVVDGCVWRWWRVFDGVLVDVDGDENTGADAVAGDEAVAPGAG